MFDEETRVSSREENGSPLGRRFCCSIHAQGRGKEPWGIVLYVNASALLMTDLYTLDTGFPSRNIR